MTQEQQIISKLIDIVKEIAVEQGTREYSGITWTQECLKKLSLLQVDLEVPPDTKTTTNETH